MRKRKQVEVKDTESLLTYIRHELEESFDFELVQNVDFSSLEQIISSYYSEDVLKVMFVEGGISSMSIDAYIIKNDVHILSVGLSTFMGNLRAKPLIINPIDIEKSKAETISCIKCGSVSEKIKTYEDGMCVKCQNKFTLKTHKELVLHNGSILTGNDRLNYMAYLKRLEKKEEKKARGEIFVCAICKRDVNIKFLSSNKRMRICTSCAMRKAEEKEFEKFGNAQKVIRDIKKAESKMTSEEKASKLSSEEDMIAKFLASKNDS